MVLVLCVTVLGIGFFITIVSYLFQREKYKYLPKATIQKLSIYNSPTAWMLYSLTIAVIIGAIFFNSLINIMLGLSNVDKQQDTIIQQQQQQTDSSEQ